MTHRNLVQDLRARPVLLASEDTFVARVLESCKRDHAIGAAHGRASRRTLALTLLASAAALAIVGVGRPRLREHWTARGSSHRETRGVSIQTLVARDHALLPIDQASLHAGDGITVRFVNDTGERRYLAVFVVDAARAVHWIYPAYVDEATNPTSIELEPNSEPRVLAEIVEPDRPASGPLRVVSVTSREPLSVKAVESRLLDGAASASDLFPEGQVQEWRCLWTSP